MAIRSRPKISATISAFANRCLLREKRILKNKSTSQLINEAIIFKQSNLEEFYRYLAKKHTAQSKMYMDLAELSLKMNKETGRTKLQEKLNKKFKSVISE